MKRANYVKKTSPVSLISMLVILLMVSPAVLSQNTENQAARKFAADFFNASAQNKKGLKSAVSASSLQQCYQSAESAKTPLFVFQQAGKGFAMVAKSNNTFKVVGYSDDETFQTGNIPPQLRALMSYYEDSLEFINPVINSLGAGTPVVPALLYEHNIRLNQYNHPEVGGSYTGCMATAITQILLFHAAESKKPVRGYGSHCYNYGSFGEICANFENANYNSDELLSYHVAVAMDMRFTTAGSSPPNMDKIDNIEKHFHYFVTRGISDDFYIKNELEHRRPLYATVIGFPENHAVVIDGYDDRNYYHLNFGWGGIFNGYFLMSNGLWFGTGNGGQKFFANFPYTYMFSPTAIPVNKQDSLALVSLHNALGGFAATNWDLTLPVRRWPGVLVMNDRVIRLTLQPKIPPATAQSIPPEIGNLTALQELHLVGCFNGTIPLTITNLTDLKKLNIANSYVYIAPTLYKGNFKSALPANIGKLTKLEWLSVSGSLEGTIPASIGNLSNLKLLRLYQDTTYYGKGKLSGAIPPEIGNLTRLNQLHISNQQLTGNLPESINNLSEIIDIDLSGNQLSGSIPAMNLPELTYLKLNGNSFSGFVEGNWDCPKLTNLELQNNQIAGSIPSFFGNFTALVNLNLSGNKIESVPEEIGNLTRLEGIAVDNNKLQALPDGLAIILNLKYLSASNNQINYIPGNLGQSHTLVTLNLSNNQITSIPEEIGNCPDLYEIYLNDNKITDIPASFANIRDAATVLLQNNEMQGAIPEKLMTSKSKNNKFVRLDNNHFVFGDIPQSDQLIFGVRDQKNVPVKKQLFKVQPGDTVIIDIRTITRLSDPGNEYYWLTYPEEPKEGMESNPILQFIASENNVRNKYYCKVFNPNSPKFSFTDDPNNFFPCMYSLNTDTIAFKLATDEELIAEKYTEEFVTSLKSISNKTVTDGTVTLVPPLKIKRGTVQWEASADGINWEKVSETMGRADLKDNVKSVGNEKLVLAPRNTAFYRCGLLEPNCDPLYSDKLKVNALGSVLFDEIINVTEASRIIDVDSIEIHVPKDFYDSDFRLTITKIDNPPAAPDSVNSGSAYDVNVSFSDSFKMPLLVKLKNFDKTKIKEKEINRFNAVYYDDLKQKWEIYEYGGISLKDSTLQFFTIHLTKLAWFEYAHGSYTHIYTSKRVNVIYKYGVGNEDGIYKIYDKYIKKFPEPIWHNKNIDPDNGGTPYMIQDIGGYMDQIINKYESLGLETPSLRFNVYVGNLKNSVEGKIDAFGYLAGRGYFYIDPIYYGKDRDNLRRTLAHEYTHYTQDYYMTVLLANYFWMEATAPLGARTIWDESELEATEPELLLKEALRSTADTKSIFDILSESWDESSTFPVIEKFTVNSTDANVSGAFLHFMQNYRRESEKLDLATLLKETSWTGSWRNYLASYVSNHVNAILGDEFEDYVKYILSGKNEKFTLLNKAGNPYAYIQNPKNFGVFTSPVSYCFTEGDEMVQKDEVEVKIPYMAAKIVLLQNLCTDTMVLVNYKRKHKFDYNHMVYHVTYDYKKKEMIYVDISDSTEYNLLLDARNKENTLEKFNNYSFLLMINTLYSGPSATLKDFDASFDLTAMPVINIASIGMLDIYSGNSPMTHTFDNKTDYVSIGSPNAAFLQKVTGFNVTRTDNNTSKRIINDHTYQIQTQFSLVIDQGQIKGMPTMKDSTIFTQTIEHDVISGIIKIEEREQKIHKLNTFIEFTNLKGEDVVERLVYNGYVDKVEDKTKTYWLKNFMNYVQPDASVADYKDVYGQNIKMFKTNNSSETQQIVSKIEANHKIYSYSQNGTLSSQSESNYVSTDFSDPNLKLNLIIRIDED